MFVLPCENEVFSSWIYRLAQVNQLNWVQFLQEITAYDSSFKTDIDRYMPLNSLLELTKVTPTNLSSILELMLSYFTNKIFYADRPGPNKWILIRGQIGIRNPTPMQAYCGVCCLPYFRRDHRIAAVCICDKCNHYLYDTCMRCNKPVIFLNNQRYRKILDLPITDCYHCQRPIFSFSKEASIPSDNLIAFQFKLIQLMTLDNSFMYFDQLHRKAISLLKLKTHHLSDRALQLLSPRKRLEILYDANIILESSI
jgi:hypothetical protein